MLATNVVGNGKKGDSGVASPPLNLRRVRPVCEASNTMQRAETKVIPTVENDYLYANNETLPVDSPRWFAWLMAKTTFYFQSPSGTFTARKQIRRGSWYWYAYRRGSRKLDTVCLGTSRQLTAQHLAEVAHQLVEQGKP